MLKAQVFPLSYGTNFRFNRETFSVASFEEGSPWVARSLSLLTVGTVLHPGELANFIQGTCERIKFVHVPSVHLFDYSFKISIFVFVHN